MPVTSQEAACADCTQILSNLLEVRRRYLCHTCFIRNVRAKILKRMEPYRLKNQVGNHRRRLLLPLSGGVSSLVLLHELDAQLKRQLETRRQSAYDLLLVHISQNPEDSRDTAWREAILSNFPGHQFLPGLELQDILQYDHNVEDDLSQLGLSRHDVEDDSALVRRLFASAKTPTARADLHELLLQRHLVAIAKKNECDGILWGHSDSRLAAKALADVAKGRGGGVPNAFVDGMSVWNINFTYPTRDLYKFELESYLQVLDKDISRCMMDSKSDNTVPVSIRNTSIDTLLINYITSQGEKYPSIMANVVRTAEKLQVPTVSEAHRCKLCSMPVVIDGVEHNLCYGCIRMKQDIKV